MEVLNRQVLAGAISADICAEWAEKIKTADVHGLLQMYIRGVDFCLSNNFPSNDFLKKNGGALLAEHGIYIDVLLNLENPAKAVLLGKCAGNIQVNNYAVSEVYAKHKSECKLSAGGNSFTVVDAFDEAVLSVSANGNAKVLVNIYGGAKVAIEQTGNAYVKVVHKNKPTY